MTSIHPLDHLVLPVAGLDIARERLSALGFTVAPTGVHPFGTANCCVFLADGTYLEPLAVGDAAVARQAIADGNTFVARDRVFRERIGEDGFSAVVFGTSDSTADHARYAGAGISAGGMVEFSRAFIDPSGTSVTASFRLAFADIGNSPAAFTFACQRIDAPKVDRSALETHANGARGIVEIVATAGDPAAAISALRTAAGADRDQAQAGELRLPNALLSLLAPAAFEARFGFPPGGGTEFRFAAVVFTVPSLPAAERLLADNAVEHHLRGSDIVVPPASGQGAGFIFREQA